MNSWFKIIHHDHSWRLRPHEHTSYLPLAFLLLVAGTVLVVFTVSSYAATPYTGPEAGSVGLTGTMPAAPPKEAATITSPRDGQHFITSPVTVSGTCPDNTLVEIYKNDIFAGSTPCDANGKYSIDIDPLFGQNILTARVYDVLNQAGPVSKAVTIFYDYSLSPAASSSFLDFSGAQLLLDTDAAYRGSFPQQQLNVPITVIGGTPPFAINVQWGDSKNQVIPRGNNTTFNAGHAYSKPGTYKITLQGTDSKQLTAFLTVAAIVNGQPELAAANSVAKASSKLVVLWPAFAIAVTALASFWVGERREKKIIKLHEKVEGTPFAAPPSPPPPAKSA
jgi:hypothetical protein